VIAVGVLTGIYVAFLVAQSADWITGLHGQVSLGFCDPGGTGATWSPDAKRIAFTRILGYPGLRRALEDDAPPVVGEASRFDVRKVC